MFDTKVARSPNKTPYTIQTPLQSRFKTRIHNVPLNVFVLKHKDITRSTVATRPTASYALNVK